MSQGLPDIQSRRLIGIGLSVVVVASMLGVPLASAGFLGSIARILSISDLVVILGAMGLVLFSARSLLHANRLVRLELIALGLGIVAGLLGVSLQITVLMGL